MQTTGDFTSIGPIQILAGLAGIPCILLGESPAQRTEQIPPLMEIGGRPVAKIVLDLGVTIEKFRIAFDRIRATNSGAPPTPHQRRANRALLAEELGVSLVRLDEVMDQFRSRD